MGIIIDFKKIVTKSNHFQVYVANSFICMLIFALDVNVETGTTISIPYIIAIMVSLWLRGTRHTIDFAVLCSLLTIFGYYLSPGSSMLHALINRAMTILAIWVTAGVAIYHKGIALKVKFDEYKKQAILSSSLDPILILDRNLIIESASTSVEKVFGWSCYEVIECSIYTFVSNKHAETCSMMFAKAAESNEGEYKGEIIAKRKDGSDFYCEISIKRIAITVSDSGEQEIVFVITMDDIGKRKEYEEKLLWFASHDGLTKVYNRRYFDTTIHKEWLRLAREKGELSLLILDIDYFKKFNDTLGHQEGDYCLTTVASTIEKCIQRPGDFIARYGGEEFAAVLPNVDKKGAEFMADKILTSIRDLKIEHPSSDCGKYITVSIGSATIMPTHDLGVDKLISEADANLYQAKEQGRNRSIASV